MNAIALLNLGGGTLQRGAAAPDQVAAALRDAGVDATVEVVPAPRLPAVTREAIRSGAELVIAGGGDGTVSAVAGALAGSESTLGVLPLGTFNHFARDLGIPGDLRGAVAALADSEVQHVDLAEVNGHRFLNNSALGFYSAVVRERKEPRVRTRLAKMMVTTAAAFRLLGNYRMPVVSLQVDGVEVSRPTPLVFISNNPAEMHLLRFGARPRLDTGKLLVHLHHGIERGAILRTVLAGLLGRDLRRAGQFDQWLTPEVEISFRRQKPVPVFLDGELLHLVPPLRYRSVPGRLKVAVPRGRGGKPLN